jgi:peptide/nickel transport system substrate-binding protein
MLRRHLLASLAALPMLAGAAAAQNLTIGIAAPVSSVDPHFFNASPNNSLSMMLFDRLVERDARARIRPGLAESWRVVGDTVWEFRLREGVRWHDGRPLTAEDVAFTYQRAPSVPNSPGGFGGFLRAVQRVEVVDARTLRIHTPAPHPNLLTELASVAIISRHAGEGAATEDYNSGRAAIGTGPYRLVSNRTGQEQVLERNAEWYGGAEPWQRVTYRLIANDGARSAALLAGDVDVIDQVASTDLPRLRADQRVRQALSNVIDRQALAERVMEGTATATAQWLPEGAFGHVPDLAPPRPDAEAARRLLAEAGFPNGFRVTLHTPQDRYPNDARTAQAVGQMWTRIGVRTQIEALTWNVFAPRSNRQEFAARLVGWGSVTGEPSYLLVNILGTFDPARRTGASNSGRYSNPALDELTARAVAVLDDERREQMLRDATRMAVEDVGLVPLFMLNNTWATRRTLAYEARMDERTIAQAVRPAP